MEILREPNRQWSFVFHCTNCDTKAKAEVADVEKDEFKVSGYWFDGSAVSETRFYVNCPSCRALHFVPKQKLTWYVIEQARDYKTISAQERMKDTKAESL